MCVKEVKEFRSSLHGISWEAEGDSLHSLASILASLCKGSRFVPVYVFSMEVSSKMNGSLSNSVLHCVVSRNQAGQ